MKYRIDITTTSRGDARWLREYLRLLERQYGAAFIEQLEDTGEAELQSTDYDGATAVSRYQLHTES